MSTSDKSNDTMANGEYRASLGFDALPGVVSVYDIEIKKEDKPLVVPVTALLTKMKGADQTTLTQIFGRPVIDLFSDESEEDDDFLPKKKRKMSIKQECKIITPTKLVICDRTFAQKGDLVTSTAAELNHPRLLFDDIDPGYVFHGHVTATDRTTVDVIWSTVEFGHRQAKVAKQNKKKQFRGIGCVSRKLVRIVAKYDSENLDKLNHFLKAAIYAEFFFTQKVGWKRIHNRTAD